MSSENKSRRPERLPDEVARAASEIMARVNSSPHISGNVIGYNIDIPSVEFYVTSDAYAAIQNGLVGDDVYPQVIDGHPVKIVALPVNSPLEYHP